MLGYTAFVQVFIGKRINAIRQHGHRQMMGVLERYVCMAPDQWRNFYDV